jgi:hypothetical protein
MVTVIFPPQFSKLLNGQLRQASAGSSLHEVLAGICEARSELKKLLFLPTQEVSPFIGFSLVGDDQLYSAKAISSRALKPGDSVEVILSMAGG